MRPWVWATWWLEVCSISIYLMYRLPLPSLPLAKMGNGLRQSTNGYRPHPTCSIWQPMRTK